MKNLCKSACVALLTVTQLLSVAAQEPSKNIETCPQGSPLIGKKCIPKTCVDSVIEKKLAGAAKSSFMKKCERDVAEACEAAAVERKLSGAAKTSNVIKCSLAAVGSAS